LASLRCLAVRRPASATDLATAIASLDHAPGIYLGCDAGIVGLHPSQAVVIADPALALRVFVDGVTVTAHDAFGAALLRHPAMAGFVAAIGRGEGRSPLAPLRAFLAAWSGAEEVRLVGALGFEAYRLATPRIAVPTGDAGSSLGVLFFAPALLRRQAAGTWERISLEFDDAVLAAARASAILPRPGAPAQAEAASTGGAVADDFPPGAYAAVIARGVRRLAGTPLVSLTLSQSFRRAVAGASIAAAFEALRTTHPAPATFFFNTGDGERVFGASPDLQLRVHARQVEAFPVCGTVARGYGPVGEAESFRLLTNEEVDAASLAVCSDALRNDLAPLCEPGSLRLRDRRRPMALATVVHTVDRLSGQLREGADAWDAIVATAAPVMATGTPRRLALEAIGALEAGPRGWYGGLVVDVAAGGDAIAGTILRAAAVRAGVAEVRTGGDLLADSDPAREEQETRVKAVSLWRALGLAVAADLQAEVAGGAGADAWPAEAAEPAAVALCDAGDPFVPALSDTMLGLGFRLDAAATTRLLIGGDEERCVGVAGHDGLVAIGDAAARVLQHAGFAVRPIRPQHGRVIRCLPGEAASWRPARPFFAARYATLEVDWAAGPGPAERARWQAWLRDEHEAPLIVAHAGRRVVCMLLRPESLMSDDLAREALRAAIFFAAGATRRGEAVLPA
jgi:anthranilate/para-aminobenzoate synthase component I